MIVETSEDIRIFSIGDLVDVDGNQDYYNLRKNGIITESIESESLLYYSVYWPNGETEIIFSGALTYADANDKESNRNRRPRRIDEARRRE